ncbi:hypothetical protein QYF36_021461 [Acer negundo]|nr:hypothetical protein QYF36_021461 [Acer negundo]
MRHTKKMVLHYLEFSGLNLRICKQYKLIHQIFSASLKRKVRNLNNFEICWEENLNIQVRRSEKKLKVILTYFPARSQKVTEIYNFTHG